MRFLAIMGLLFLAACAASGPTCSEPYIVHGNSCCLDRDANGVCDVDENASLTAPSNFDCSVCAPKFVTEKEEVIVYKYVCMNSSIVNTAEECGERIVSNADQFKVQKEQDDTKILEFEARPACRGKYRAAEVHLVPATPALNVTFEVKGSPDAPFSNLASVSGQDRVLDEVYMYIGFCDSRDCESVVDAALSADTAYVVRAVLLTVDGSITSRELLLDPTPEGAYAQQRC